MIADYHVHSRWCRHGEGEIEEYIQRAIDCGLKEIAITEHVPHEHGFTWIRWEEVPLFDRELNRNVERFQDQIHVIKGFECEYFEDEIDVYRRFQEEMGYHLLVLGQHNYGKEKRSTFSPMEPDGMYQYAEDICKGLETGIFSFLAHPDCAMIEYKNGWDRHCETAMLQIFQACSELHIPVEINGNGVRDHRPYPCEEAFRLSLKFPLEYLVNSDAHKPQFICDDGVKGAEKLAQKLGIPLLQMLDIKTKA